MKEKQDILEEFIERNRELLSKYPVIIIGYGHLSEARKYGISLVQTPYILNLDSDVIIPKNFVDEALKEFQDDKVVAISIPYDPDLQGHLPFGPSLWRTKILQDLYDWTEDKGYCECRYIFNKMEILGYKVKTIEGMHAIHLRRC
jgi:cellulose synthase/poly-beta-1,6-N-acetylglucosamine synthase-like glycosyltransferase